jgi:YidC/Oxa1 family membrane protein insertase
MVRVAPELKALQAKHKDDKQRQQQEVMKFYADNKINPFASCLPLVAQMPFFIGLFYLLQSDLRREICGKALTLTAAGKPPPCSTLAGANGSESFLFIPDLTDKATGWVLGVLIVLYVGSQLLSSILTPSTADRNQRMLMYALPFVFLIFVIRFPAGLIVYWITTNLWTVTQGYVLRRRMGPISMPKLEPAVAGAAGAASGGRAGGFMARMAAATSARGAADPEPEPAGKASGGGGSSKSTPAKPRSSAASATKAGAASSAKPTGAAAKSGGSGRARSSKSSEASATAAAAKPSGEGPPPPPPRKKKKRSGRRR